MPKFSGEGRIGLLMEIVVIILEQIHVTEAWVIWPLFGLGALLIADWIFRGEWREKHDELPKQKKTVAWSVAASIFLLACGGWLVFRLGYFASKTGEAKKEPPQASGTTTLQLVPPPGGWLPEWGAPIPPLGVRSIVDLSTLIPYQKPIPLMLVYWIVDNAVDEQNETRIIKSNIFTVAANPRLTIDVQLSAQFLERVAPQKSEKLIVPMKVALLALPRTARPDDISRISDATKLGGAVLTVNGFPFPVEAKVTKLHP